MSSLNLIDARNHHCDCMCNHCEQAGTGYNGFFLHEEEAAQVLAPAHLAIVRTYGKFYQIKKGKLRSRRSPKPI